MRHARQEATGRVPCLLQTWLWAAEAEALASAGEERSARSALEEADRLLPADAVDPELPFVILDATHLGRWRGYCLARLGATEASTSYRPPSLSMIRTSLAPRPVFTAISLLRVPYRASMRWLALRLNERPTSPSGQPLCGNDTGLTAFSQAARRIRPTEGEHM